MDSRIGLLTREGKPLYYTTAYDLYFEGPLSAVIGRLIEMDKRRSRIERNVQYVFFGITRTGIVEIAIDTDYNCIKAASLWAKTYRGDVECYCVQNGVLGGRPFYKQFSDIAA